MLSLDVGLGKLSQQELNSSEYCSPEMSIIELNYTSIFTLSRRPLNLKIAINCHYHCTFLASCNRYKCVPVPLQLANNKLMNGAYNRNHSGKFISGIKPDIAYRFGNFIS